MSSPLKGPNEFYINYVQQQIDRRFSDMQSDLDRRFNNVDKDNEDIKKRLDRLEVAPRDSFRAYVAPILIAIITAVILTFLVGQGVVAK